MRLDTYEQVEAVTRRLFLQQVGLHTPEEIRQLEHERAKTLDKRFHDTPLKLKKELDQARGLLRMRRGKGGQRNLWSKAPGQVCKSCRSLAAGQA